MASASSVIGSGRTWIGFVAGAIATVACPITILFFLDRVDPPPPGGARPIKAAADIFAITEALELYRIDHGQFPNSEHGLSALVPDQLERIPVDPWGMPYAYSLVDGVPSVASLGSDGAHGGVGAATDVTLDTIETVLGQHGRFVPEPIGVGLVLFGGLIPSIIALRIPGRPYLAVGILAGTAFAIASLSLVFGTSAADQTNGHLTVIVGLLFAAVSLGVLLRLRHLDSIAMAGFLMFVITIWILSNSIAR